MAICLLFNVNQENVMNFKKFSTVFALIFTFVALSNFAYDGGCPCKDKPKDPKSTDRSR